jgi:hypothetical protein
VFDISIAISICLVNHLLQLLVSHILAQFLGNAFQISERNLACLVVVEESKRFEDLFLCV